MPPVQFARRFALLAFAFSWGAVLVYAGMYMSGIGHGTYVPFALATAPLSLFPLFFGNRNSFWFVIFAVPFWWTFMMSIAGLTKYVRYLWLVLIATHYAGAMLLIYRTDVAFGLDGRAFRGMLHIRPLWTVGVLLLYAIGQAVMWHEFFSPYPAGSASPVLAPGSAVPLEAVPEVAPAAGDVASPQVSQGAGESTPEGGIPPGIDPAGPGI
jgi:hypothetical protein